MAVGTKPVGIRPVNLGHPLARGLFDFVPFNEGSGLTAKNYANLGAAATATGSPTWASCSAGIGAYCTGGASFDIPAHGNFSNQPGGFTFRCVFYPKTWPANFAPLFDSPNREFMITFDTSGNVDFVVLSGVNPSNPSSLGLTAGFVWDLVCTYDPAIQTLSYYVNGLLAATTSGVAPNSTPNDVISFGRNPSGGGANPDIIYLLAQIWNGRCLRAGEVAFLHADRGGWGFLARKRSLLKASAAQTFQPSWAIGSNVLISGGYAA